ILVLGILMTTGERFWVLAYLGVAIGLAVLGLLYCLANAIEDEDNYADATVAVWLNMVMLFASVLQLGLVLFGRKLPPWRSPKKQKEDMNL
ncbi:MAG TPA: hypothetical protein VFO02_03130, partial [Burkholderiales bacterium]|nr:hypothetical protein [Burkholderiales bacterium]